MSDRPTKRAESWFRRLAALFPGDFRARHQQEMEQLFRDELASVRRPGDGVRLWTRTVVGTLVWAPREHAAILAQDLRSALRALRAHPGTSLVVVLTLAVGIAANTAVFSVVNTVQLRELPFEHGERLVRIFLSDRGAPPLVSLRPEIYRLIAEEGEFFDRIVAQRFTDFTVQGFDGPERVAGMAVTAGWAETLGVEPWRGRLFSVEEEALGRASRAVLVSHRFWQSRLGGEEAAVGREVEIDGERFTVVGVLPPGFHYPYDNDLWIPLVFERDPEGLWGLNVQARLRPGVSLDEARSALGVLTEQLEAEGEVSLAGMGLWPVPIREDLADDKEVLVLTLLGAVGFLLLLVCVNVGNLVLARSLERQREYALRAALGASRSRQLRQSLTEAAVLAAAGGGLGWALAWVARQWLHGLLPGRLGNLVDTVPFDGRVLAFTFAATTLTAVGFGLAPALRAATTRLHGLMQENGRTGSGPRRGRLLGGLIAIEAALALVLLASAASMIVHYRTLFQVDLGYRPEGLITAQLPLDGPAHRDARRRQALVREIERRLADRAGIERVGTINHFPSPSGNFLADVDIEGRPKAPEERNIVNHRLVTPGFFATLGIELLEGRVLQERDREDAEPVAVVSRSMAKRYWPEGSAVGQRVRNAREGEEGRWLRVVGVVEDVREFWQVEETWYLSYLQQAHTDGAGQAVLLVRSDLPAGAVDSAMRAVVTAVDGSLPIESIAPARQRYRATLEQERSSSLLAGALAAVGVGIALIGVAGVTAFASAARTRELGLRRALGARRSDLLGSVLGGVARWSGLGVALGALLYALLARSLGALLPGAAPLSLDRLGLLALLLVLAGVAAAALPAGRASRVDPAVALRRP